MKTPFRTAYHLPRELPLKQIDAMQGIVGLGSCFAIEMGKRFDEAKFPAALNPMGIAYHPLALAAFIQWGLGQQPDWVPLFAPQTQSWVSFDLHSDFNQADAATFVSKASHQLQVLRTALAQADWLLLTFGTAIVYVEQKDQLVVNNCHKFPAAHFSKRLLDLSEILECWHPAIEQLMAHRPDINVILTVSPIRHIKEGLSQNSVSKALLRVAAEQLSQAYDQVHYFPAYEIMMDDLRDYRFFASDMIHPNEVAQQYIWDQFARYWFTPAAQQQIKTWGRIAQGLNHRPLQPWSSANQKFWEQLRDQTLAFAETYEVDCTAEITQIEGNLSD